MVRSAQSLRATLALLIAGLVTFALLYTTQPLLPVFTQEFHVQPVDSSLSLSITTLTLSVSMLFAGSVSVRIGRKRVMVGSLLISSFLTVLMAACSHFSELIGLRALMGVTLAGVPSLAMAYVRDEFPAKAIGAMMGIYVGGTTVGGMTGRIAMGALTDSLSWRMGFLAIGGACLLLSAIFSWALPGEHPDTRSKRASQLAFFSGLREKIADRSLLPLYFIGFFLMGGFVTMYNYISYLLVGPPYHLSQTQVGWIFLMYLLGTVASIWMGRVADVKGRVWTFRFGATIMLTGVLITISTPLVARLVGLALCTFGFFAGQSVASGWVGERAQSGTEQASSLYLLFYYVGSSMAGTVGGVFWTHSGWPGIVLFVSSLICAGIACSVWASAGKSERQRCW